MYFDRNATMSGAQRRGSAGMDRRSNAVWVLPQAVNSAQFCSVTGAAPPHEPPNAKEYNEAGLPWFEYYDAERTALRGAPRLARIDSLAVRRLKEGAAPLEADTGGEPDRERIVPLGPKPHRVREGSGW